MRNRKRDLLRAAAARAADKPFFLGAVLRDYQEGHGMDDAQLSSVLGCDPADLPRLRLCRRPDPSPTRFRADVERIAGHFGLMPIALARVVREVDATRRLRRATLAGEGGALLAARDGALEGEVPSGANEPGERAEPRGED